MNSTVAHAGTPKAAPKSKPTSDQKSTSDKKSEVPDQEPEGSNQEPEAFDKQGDELDMIRGLARKIVGDKFDDDEAASIDLVQVRRDAFALMHIRGLAMGFSRNVKYAWRSVRCEDGKLPYAQSYKTNPEFDGDLCFAITLPLPREDSKIYLEAGGNPITVLDDGGITVFRDPLNLAACFYHSFSLRKENGQPFTEPFYVQCVHILDEKLRGAFMRGSKRLLYRFTRAQKERTCMYRGMVLPESCRNYIF
jgi:hypothetical protein